MSLPSTQGTLLRFDPSQPERPRYIAYTQWGAPDNPDVVFCVHGLSRNGRDFDALAEALSTRYRVICPDMAGRGRSSWLSQTKDYHYFTYVEDCVALCAQLGITCVHWIGTSMGGIIGMMLHASMPQLFRSLVLNDIGSVVAAEGLRRILGYVGTTTHFATKESALDYLKQVLAPFGITTDVGWRYMFERSMIPLPDGQYALAYDPAVSQPFKEAALKPEGGQEIADVDLTALWQKVACPVLLIRGAQSDIVRTSTVEAMRNTHSTMELLEIAGAGHAPALIAPEEIYPIIQWISAR